MKRAERELQILNHLITREKGHWEQGVFPAGMDEVGRGPLAGPVLTCAIVMPSDPLILGVNDSKKISERKRERLYDEIISCALQVGIGMRDEACIDRINILEATKQAFCEAAEQLQPAPPLMLIDAVRGVPLHMPQEIIVRGDNESYLIAAASIVAKVTRDRMMIDYDQAYPEYGFARNKGYGTAEHIAAIRKYGPCPIHRRSFIRKFLSEI